MKKKIIFLIYGLLLISIWSVCFMTSGKSDAYTAIMGMLFTFLSSYFLQKEYDFKLTVLDKITLAAFPILYLSASYFVLFDRGYFSTSKHGFYMVWFYIHLINPLNVACIVLLLGLTILKDVFKPLSIFIFMYIALFYAYLFHSDWRNIWIGSQMDDFDVELPQGARKDKQDDMKVNYAEHLSNFLFINASLDTIEISNAAGKYTLLETWSEGCFPCIKAMNELPDFYQSINNKVDVYYVYESDRASTRKNFKKIFNFESIKDKSQILIDINQELYEALNMKGFPYFLLFDSTGNLIYHSRGYLGKETLSSQILAHIQ
jgi:thioredoxin-related protein